MGNEQQLSRSCDQTETAETESNRSQHLTNYIRSKFKKPVKNAQKPVNNDEFIIQYNQNNDHIIDNIESLDQRRVVFVSVIGLYQTWKNMPSAALYTALLLLPLKRQWIFKPSKYIHELQSHFTFQLYASDPDIKQFIQMLKWKDQQGLAVWIMDDYTNYNDSNGTEIHPFWHFLNTKLASLYDPITGSNYKKLTLNLESWKNDETCVSQYGATTSSICSELCFLTMKFSTIQEILYESNPSLNPIKRYKPVEHTENDRCTTCTIPLKDNGKDNWCILERYDSYDGTTMEAKGLHDEDSEMIIESIAQFNALMEDNNYFRDLISDIS